MIIDVNWTVNLFALYTNIKPLHCIPETNIMSCQSYLNKKIKLILKIKKTSILFLLSWAFFVCVWFVLGEGV